MHTLNNSLDTTGKKIINESLENHLQNRYLNPESEKTGNVTIRFKVSEA